MNIAMIEMSLLEELAPVARIAAHPLRLRIIEFLRSEGACNVTQIVGACGAPQAVVSQNLKVLRDQGILSSCRRSNFMYYELKDRKILFLLDCIQNQTL